MEAHLFRPSGIYQADAGQSAEWNRGAYLVQGLEHCGACHTPHGLTQQEKAFDARDNAVYLSGFDIGGWNAPNLRSDVAGGLGKWDVDGIVAFLRAGRNSHTAAFGAMTEAIGASTQYLTDEDLRAMAVYLKSLPPKSAGLSTDVAASSSVPRDSTIPNPLRQGRIESPGAKVYLDNCNACHRSDGSGASRVFPALAGNSAVLSDDPTSLIHVVLDGSHMAATAASPVALGMPPFGWRLGNQQVADVLTYVRSTWGNQASAVTAQSVGKLRHD